MSTLARRRTLQEMRMQQGDIEEKLANATIGTRTHELLSDLHYHLDHVITISEELLVIEERGETVAS